jgi:hypothetical protein
VLGLVSHRGKVLLDGLLTCLVVGDVVGLLGGDGGSGEKAYQPGEDKGYDEVGQGDCGSEEEKTCATCHAYSRDEPDGGGGGEAVDSILSDEDQSSSDEADACHDLGGDTRGVEHDQSGSQYVCEAILGDEEEESCGGADDGVGAKSGALVPNLPLEPDQGREEECST